MPRPWQFQLSTRILFGRGALRRVGETAREFGGSALLVGYREPGALAEAYGRAAKALEKAGVRVVAFADVTADPGAEIAVHGLTRVVEAGVEMVVAVGGGSVMDAAKGIAAVARMGGSLWDYADANPQSRPVSDALPLIAVPTTAGTGSEVSRVAAFTFGEAGARIKAAIYGPGIMPKVALIDPDLAVDSPGWLTAACGADALGHAIEAHISRTANPLSSVLACRAVGLIVENLPRALQSPRDAEPREAMAQAALLAGAAFNEAGVTAAHAIAHALGAVLGAPHGVGVAVALPPTLRFNASACVSPYAELAEECCLGGGSAEEKAERFVERIERLLCDTGLVPRLEPAVPPPDLADRLVAAALGSSPSPITCNPRKLDAAAIRQLLGECCRW